MSKMLKVGAAALCVVFAAGCTDLKPLQQQVDDLKAQVGRNSSEVAAMKTAVDAATRTAQAAQTAAQQAQSRADAAATAAQASQSCCDATNEKIDRMFKRSMSK
jgi:outer membrane murein-binding lipoprotein Lpp